jgi:hypothetical protein
MVTDQEQKKGLKNTLFSLLERGAGPDLDQAGLLTLLSLVNLMGIIDLLAHRLNTSGD